MLNVYSTGFWLLGSDLVTPKKEVESSTQQGVVSDDNNLQPQGMQIQSTQVDAGAEVGFMKHWERQLVFRLQPCRAEHC